MNTNPVVTQFTGDARPFFAEIDKVRKELGGFRGDIARIGNSVSTFIKGYLTFAAVRGVMSGIVRETGEAAQATAGLNNALATARAEVTAASAEYQAYALNLQKTTTFTQEAAEEVTTLLLSFQGLSGHVIKDATGAVLDLSTRMGMDAPSAAKLLGKALQDPEEGLTKLARAGVAFSDAQKRQIKDMQDAGDVAGAQALILKELEERFGGAAEAARDNFGGAIIGAKNAMADLLEGDGTGINAAADSINELTKILESPELRNAVGELVSGLADIISFTAKAAAGLAILFTGKGGNQAVDIDKQIERLEKERKFLQGNAGMRPEDMNMPGPLFSEDLFNSDMARIKAIDAEVLKLREDWNKLMGFGEFGPGGAKEVKPKPKEKDPLNFTTPGVDQAAEDKAKLDAQIAKDMTAFENSLNDKTDMQIRAGQEEVDRALEAEQFWSEMYERSIAAEEEYQYEKSLLAEQGETARRQFIEKGVNASANLLQVLFGKHKAVAAAIFLLQKRQAIAETIIQTKQAVMTTYARLGYPWGIPAAIAVAALGAAQVAEMIATNPGTSGIITGGSTGGGGVYAPGTPNNPVYTEDSGTQLGASSQRALQVIFAGPVYGMDDFKDQLVDIISSEINDRDVIVINGRSRQAAELRNS